MQNAVNISPSMRFRLHTKVFVRNAETRYIADAAIGQASHFVRRYKEKLNNEDKNGKEDS